MTDKPANRKSATRNLAKAVHQNKRLSADGTLERLFTWLFKGLVYPQIWEDPEIDMEALAIQPGDRIVAIASGGCNVMSYLVANPGSIMAVDLNHAHVALNRLKITAASVLPDHSAFYRFFGSADEKANLVAYDHFIKPRLDPQSRAYWERRGWTGKRRIAMFSRDLYHHGLLGWFIGAGHRVARLYGIDPSDMLKARTLEEQRSFFDRALAPLFDKRMIRWATSKKASLFGLGIPPAQYEALAASGGGDMALVLRQRLERLACDFPLSENYFAWQAFGRSYQDADAGGEAGPLPPYLQARHFDAVRERADRISVENRSVTELLAEQPDGSINCFVFLDAQDWMTDAQLNDLWCETTRTAAPGARAIFRTAAEPSLLPGRVEDDTLDHWDYRTQESIDWTRRDRSSIYGGFHLYVKKR
jgi:S-adenosylmethionine-diacylglycerol 3-amino-3-carboxypropyl transferase